MAFTESTIQTNELTASLTTLFAKLVDGLATWIQETHTGHHRITDF